LDWRHFAILISLAGFSGDAAAYPIPVDFSGTLLRWKILGTDDPVYYEIINDSTIDMELATQLVSSSTGIWSNVEGSDLRLASAAETAGSSPKITVNFNSTFDGGDFAAAYAAMDEYDLDGNPAHCSVHIAIRGGEQTSDLEKTILHELGHCLGLGHSLFPKAIMSYRLEENSFALDVDDMVAIRRHYAADGTGAALPPGCTIGRKPGKKSQASNITWFIDPFILLLPAIAWLTGRRLRG